MSICFYTGVLGGGAVAQFHRSLGPDWTLDDHSQDGRVIEGAPRDKTGDLITLTIGGNNLLMRPVSEPAAHRRAKGRGKLFFMHIPKTAGSALNELICARYEPHRTTTHIESKDWWNRPELAGDNDYLSGHVRLGQATARLDLADFFQVTLLREPLAQFASHLAWVRSVADDEESQFFRQHPEHIRAISRSLQTVDLADPASLSGYLAAMERHELNLFDNCQTRYFLDGEHAGRLDRAALERAVEALERLDVVGLVEEYQVFVRAVFELVGWESPGELPRVNVRPERYGLDLADPATREVIRPFVEYDERLYAAVQEQWRLAAGADRPA